MCDGDPGTDGFAEVTKRLKDWERDIREDFETAVKDISIVEGGVAVGTWPASIKVRGSKDNHGSNGVKLAVMYTSEELLRYVLRLYEHFAPAVAFSPGIIILNIELLTATMIVALAVSPYISITRTDILEGITFAGAIPVNPRVALSNVNHDGVCTVIEDISDLLAG